MRRLLKPDEYQAKASSIFQEVKAQLSLLLPAARVEHVGASSIAGAISKGDIDICVIVDSEKIDSAIRTLESAGYTIKPDTLRTPELCMLVSQRTDIDLALQVIASGSTFECFILFRDALRANADLVTSYNLLKQRCVGLDDDMYRGEKSRFIEDVLSRYSA